MVKTRKSTAENTCSHSDDEAGFSAASRRRSQRLSASMNVSRAMRVSLVIEMVQTQFIVRCCCKGGRRHSVEIEETVIEGEDDDVMSSPDESWQETPRRSTRYGPRSMIHYMRSNVVTMSNVQEATREEQKALRGRAD